MHINETKRGTGPKNLGAVNISCQKNKEGKLTLQCNLALGMPFGIQVLPRLLT